MVKKKRTKVSRELRNQITLALLEPGCDLNELARKYKLARSTLLRYRQQYRRQQAGDGSLQRKSPFIEVTVEESKRNFSLKKVELSFDSCKCSVEGRLSSSQLLKLVELLERSTC